MNFDLTQFGEYFLSLASIMVVQVKPKRFTLSYNW